VLKILFESTFEERFGLPKEPIAAMVPDFISFFLLVQKISGIKITVLKSQKYQE
jgi:hypothetical protein